MHSQRLAWAGGAARVNARTQARRSMRALLLDEPTSSLDPRHQLLLRTVPALARAEGIAALVVLHDVNLAAQWCHRLLLLGRGRSVAQGSRGADGALAGAGL